MVSLIINDSCGVSEIRFRAHIFLNKISGELQIFLKIYAMPARFNGDIGKSLHEIKRSLLEMFRRKKYSTLHFIAVLSVLAGLVFSISGPGLSGAVHANNLPETAAATVFSDASPAPAERPGQKTPAFEENRGAGE